MRMFPLGLLLAFSLASDPGLVWNDGFARAPLWNDGNAEVSTYEATDVRYGAPRLSRAVLIVVAEDLSREKLVKTDRPAGEPRTLRVLKLNHVRSIATGVYSYQQMLSLFLGVDRLEPVKLSMTSHEWCGNTFVEWRSDRNILSIRSYFENVADRDTPLSPAGAVFYDSLPLKLRSLNFGATREGRLTVLDSLFASAPSEPAAREALLRVTPATNKAYRVVLMRGALSDVFEFDAAYPHTLRLWERSDGGSLKLLDSRRFRYWEKNAAGDEALLPRVRPLSN